MPQMNELLAGSQVAFLRKLCAEPWYILPTALDAIYSMAHTLEAAEIGRKFDNDYRPKVENGIAIIPVRGTMMRRAGLMAQYFGAVDHERIESDYLKAMADPEVKGILLDFDSPGGTVFGTDRLARVIRENKTKPVGAFTGSLMASAAYYAGSAADFIVADKDSEVGSIGVRITHVEASQWYRDVGIKITHIVAGEDKALGSDSEPLDKRGRDYLQGFVDDAYKQFTAAVQLHRGSKIQSVEQVANGRVYTATDALALGLIDKIGTIETALDLLNGGDNMDLNELKAKHPELVKAIRAEVEAEIAPAHAKAIESAKAECATKSAEAATAAVQAERDRTSKIKAEAAPGQEVLVEKLIADGVTVDAAIVALFQDLKARPAPKPAAEQTPAEKAAADALALLNGSAPKVIEQPSTPAGGKLIDQLEKITDPKARAEFCRKNGAAMQAEIINENKK